MYFLSVYVEYERFFILHELIFQYTESIWTNTVNEEYAKSLNV
jgi:hypothetical protein